MKKHKWAEVSPENERDQWQVFRQPTTGWFLGAVDESSPKRGVPETPLGSI